MERTDENVLRMSHLSFLVCVWSSPMLCISSWVMIPTASASVGWRQVRILIRLGRPDKMFHDIL